MFNTINMMLKSNSELSTIFLKHHVALSTFRAVKSPQIKKLTPNLISQPEK